MPQFRRVQPSLCALFPPLGRAPKPAPQIQFGDATSPALSWGEETLVWIKCCVNCEPDAFGAAMLQTWLHRCGTWREAQGAIAMRPSPRPKRSDRGMKVIALGRRAFF